MGKEKKDGGGGEGGDEEGRRGLGKERDLWGKLRRGMVFAGRVEDDNRKDEVV